MPRLSRRSGLAAIVLALIPGASSNPAGASGLKLAYRPTSGDGVTYRTRLTGTTDMFAGDARTGRSNVSSELFITQKVSPLTGDQLAVATRVLSGQVTVDGVDQEAPMVGETVLATMKTDGSLVESGTRSMLAAATTQFVLPRTELTAGSHWEESIPASQDSPVGLTVRYVVDGEEEIHGVRCLRIRSTVESARHSPVEGLSLMVKADGTIYFSPEHGRVVQNKTSSRMDMVLKRIVNRQEERFITRTAMTSITESVD